MKILVSTVEGYRKDNTIQSKKRFADRPVHFQFTGDDAPEKAVRAMVQKYGIPNNTGKEEMIQAIQRSMKRFGITKDEL